MKILVLNGINLNMFGKRDPAQYGTTTLAEIDDRLRTLLTGDLNENRAYWGVFGLAWLIVEHGAPVSDDVPDG